jgi:hypothetical protein
MTVANESENSADQEQDQEQDEQDLRDPRRARGDSTETKDRSHDSYQKKYQRIVQHGQPPFSGLRCKAQSLFGLSVLSRQPDDDVSSLSPACLMLSQRRVKHRVPQIGCRQRRCCSDASASGRLTGNTVRGNQAEGMK